MHRFWHLEIWLHRNGMQVLIREGSAARNLDAIVKGIVEHHTDTSSFCFCTDDKHIEEIRKEGHINYNVKRAVQLGLPVEKALQMATIQPARCYGLYSLGMIAPGRQADFVILDNVTDLNVVDVYHCGKKIIKDEKAELKPCPPYLKNTVHVSGFSEERLKLKHPGTKARVIQMLEKQIVTRDVLEEVPWIESDGEKYFAPDGEYQKIAVIERHKNTGKMGVGIIKGYGIRGGAIASSVSHDSHRNDADARWLYSGMQWRDLWNLTTSCHGTDERCRLRECKRSTCKNDSEGP